MCRVLVERKYPHARKSLCDQLSASIHVRGISLQYMQDHNEKLAYRRQYRDTTGETARLSRGAISDDQKPVAQSKVILAEKQKGVLWPETIPSTVTPSARVRISQMKKGPSSSIISSGSTVEEGQDEDDYPPKPEQGGKGKYQPCSICNMPLDILRLTDRSWRCAFLLIVLV